MIDFDSQKVDILGTPYLICQDDTLKERERDGECDTYKKEIHLRAVDDMLDATDDVKAKEIRYKEVFLHECIHALFWESGADDYCDDERLVILLERQLPKLYKTLVTMGVLE